MGLHVENRSPFSPFSCEIQSRAKGDSLLFFWAHQQGLLSSRGVLRAISVPSSLLSFLGLFFLRKWASEASCLDRPFLSFMDQDLDDSFFSQVVLTETQCGLLPFFGPWTYLAHPSLGGVCEHPGGRLDGRARQPSSFLLLTRTCRSRPSFPRRGDFPRDRA